MKLLLLVSLMAYSTFLHAQKVQQTNPTTKQVDPKIDASVLANAPIRFSGVINETFGATGDMQLVSRYNTNFANINFGPGGVNIKKSGLYHFEGLIAVGVYGNNAKGLPELNYSLQVGTDNYHIVRRQLIPLREFEKTNGYSYSEKFSIELYITAPATITLKRQIAKAEFAIASNILSEGWFTGYRMGD